MSVAVVLLFPVVLWVAARCPPAFASAAVRSKRSPGSILRGLADQKARTRISFGRDDACWRERPRPIWCKIPRVRPARRRSTASTETLGLIHSPFSRQLDAFRRFAQCVRSLATRQEIGSSTTDAIPFPAPTKNRSAWISSGPMPHAVLSAFSNHGMTAIAAFASKARLCIPNTPLDVSILHRPFPQAVCSRIAQGPSESPPDSIDVRAWRIALQQRAHDL